MVRPISWILRRRFEIFHFVFWSFMTHHRMINKSWNMSEHVGPHELMGSVKGRPIWRQWDAMKAMELFCRYSLGHCSSLDLNLFRRNRNSSFSFAFLWFVFFPPRVKLYTILTTTLLFLLVNLIEFVVQAYSYRCLLTQFPKSLLM